MILTLRNSHDKVGWALIGFAGLCYIAIFFAEFPIGQLFALLSFLLGVVGYVLTTQGDREAGAAFCWPRLALFVLGLLAWLIKGPISFATA